jgi:hypothetical protein
MVAQVADFEVGDLLCWFEQVETAEELIEGFGRPFGKGDEFDVAGRAYSGGLVGAPQRGKRQIRRTGEGDGSGRGANVDELGCR